MVGPGCLVGAIVVLEVPPFALVLRTGIKVGVGLIDVLLYAKRGDKVGDGCTVGIAVGITTVGIAVGCATFTGVGDVCASARSVGAAGGTVGDWNVLIVGTGVVAVDPN